MKKIFCALISISLFAALSLTAGCGRKEAAENSQTTAYNSVIPVFSVDSDPPKSVSESSKNFESLLSSAGSEKSQSGQKSEIDPSSTSRVEDFVASLGTNFTVDGEYVVLFVHRPFHMEVDGDKLYVNYNGDVSYGLNRGGVDYTIERGSDGVWRRRLSGNGDYTLGKVADTFRNILSSVVWTNYDPSQDAFTGRGEFSFGIFEFRGYAVLTFTSGGAVMTMDNHRAEFSDVGTTSVTLPDYMV